MTSSIRGMIKAILTFGRPRPMAPKQDYSWMDNDQMAEWEALRAIEMALFDADAKPVNKQIFHHPV